VASHYDDPERLMDRIARLGYAKAAQVLKVMLPTTKRARSGHLGEILTTESVPALLRPFKVPIKRLRWADGRESALRGEDLIGLAIETQSVNFCFVARWPSVRLLGISEKLAILPAKH
jgi:hypothetical protein